MAEPAKRRSKTRTRRDRAKRIIKMRELIKCAHCGAQVQSHTVCLHCGYYRGVKAI